MSEKTFEGAKREYAEWRRYAVGVLEQELARLGAGDARARWALLETVRRLRWDSGYVAHQTLLAVARLAVSLPHLVTSYSVLPDPRQAEEWVRALEVYETPATADFHAWKSSVAIRAAAEYAKTGVKEYADIVLGILRMRRDGVPKLIAALLEVDKQLAAELAPDEARLRSWLLDAPRKKRGSG